MFVLNLLLAFYAFHFSGCKVRKKESLTQYLIFVILILQKTSVFTYFQVLHCRLYAKNVKQIPKSCDAIQCFLYPFFAPWGV